MYKLVLTLSVAVLASCLQRTSFGEENDGKSNGLVARLEKLVDQVTVLEKSVNELKQENDRLKNWVANLASKSLCGQFTCAKPNTLHDAKSDGMVFANTAGNSPVPEFNLYCATNGKNRLIARSSIGHSSASMFVPKGSSWRVEGTNSSGNVQDPPSGLKVYWLPISLPNFEPR